MALKNPIIPKEEVEYCSTIPELFVNVYAIREEAAVWYGTPYRTRIAAQHGRTTTMKLAYRIHIIRKKPHELEKTR